MHNYVALLGNTPLLSLAELDSVLSVDITRVAKHAALFSLEDDETAVELQEKLGGVFKIFKMIQPLIKEDAQEQIATYLLQLASHQSGKIEFALGFFEQESLEIDSRAIKKILSDNDCSSRYLESDTWGLSSAVLKHQRDIHDLMISKYQDQHWLLETVAVQDADEWSLRDRRKPYVSGKKGMLPPKVARIMVNLAIGHFQKHNLSDASPLLYDPFCGTGTVLIEAVTRNCRIIGSDIDADAIDGTNDNLIWFEKQLNQAIDFNLFQSDVTHAKDHLKSEKIDLIVTEPFLGKPNPKLTELENIFDGLGSLYLGAFKAWIQILKKGSMVVIVFPYVETPNKRFDLSGLIDKLERFGYTLQVKPIDYHRENAEVKRQILIFRYQ